MNKWLYVDDKQRGELELAGKIIKDVISQITFNHREHSLLYTALYTIEDAIYKEKVKGRL